MRTRQQQLILDMAAHRISKEDFLREIGTTRTGAPEFALRTLEEAYRQESVDDVECGLHVGFCFGFTLDFLDILIRLSDAEWHQRHEDVVTALDGLASTLAIDALYRAALKIHPYLEFDGCRALATKAIWALGNLRDATADQKLKSLAESDEPIIRAGARKQLYRRSDRVTPEERKRGNALCLRIDQEKDLTIRAQLLQQLRDFNEQQRVAEQDWMTEQGWANDDAEKS